MVSHSVVQHIRILLVWCYVIILIQSLKPSVFHIRRQSSHFNWMLLHCASAVVKVTIFHDDCCTTLFLLLEPGCVAWYKFPFFSFPGVSSGHWTVSFPQSCSSGYGFWAMAPYILFQGFHVRQSHSSYGCFSWAVLHNFCSLGKKWLNMAPKNFVSIIFASRYFDLTAYSSK